MAAGKVNVSRREDFYHSSKKSSVYVHDVVGGAKRDAEKVLHHAWGGDVMDFDSQDVSLPQKRRRLSPDVREAKNSKLVQKLMGENWSEVEESSDGSHSSLTYQTGCSSDDREPGQLDEEDFSHAPNITTSRWASDDDLLDETTDEGEGNRMNMRRTPESEARSRGSEEGHLEKKSFSADGRLESELDNDDELMEDVEADVEGFSSGKEFESDKEEEEEEAVVRTPERPCRDMMQACRSVFEYERLGKINEGSYGVVFRARDKKTGEVVAMKKLKMGREREGFPLYYLREINSMLSFNHPSLVGVKEVVVDDSDEGFGNVFMVMEHMEHDLKDLMQSRSQPFSQSEVKCLMLQLLEGVKYLHDNWVLHRDLKTSNLLLNNQGDLKICDFGMSRQYGSPLKPYTSLVVTLWYRAPELLLGAKEYSTAVDMWSVGCIMAELLSSKPLFDGKAEVEQLNKIFAILGTPNDKIWPGFSQLPGAKANFSCQRYNLLSQKFPRASFTGSPVLSDLGLDLLSKLLTYDPEKRITAEEALLHPWFSEVPLPKSKEFMPTFPVQYSHKR